METLFLEFGLKDGIFVGMFIWLLIYVLRKSDARENKLYLFLDDMKFEFAKLVDSYESLARNVNEIRKELHEFRDRQD